jgi:hypothetical protein
LANASYCISANEGVMFLYDSSQPRTKL